MQRRVSLSDTKNRRGWKERACIKLSSITFIWSSCSGSVSGPSATCSKGSKTALKSFRLSRSINQAINWPRWTASPTQEAVFTIPHTNMIQHLMQSEPRRRTLTRCCCKVYRAFLREFPCSSLTPRWPCCFWTKESTRASLYTAPITS